MSWCCGSATSRAAGCRRSTRDTFDRLAEIKTGGVPIRVAASPDGKWIVTSNLGAGG